ncbi:MAG: UbiA family prenyltransferase [Candidatus Micrarchaeales archaeon]
MNKVIAIFKLTRIEHSIMLVIAVIAAELIVGGIPPLNIFILSLLTPFLTSMGAFAINDYFDVETDRANKRKERPIVSGDISRKSAYKIALLCLIFGTAGSIFINIYAFAIAVVFSILSYLYSYKLKDILLIGNAYIAFSMAIPFIYGNFVVATQINSNIVLITFIIFLSGLAREIHGMIRDKSGDLKIRKSKNLVYYIGANKSAWFALILYAESIMISIFLFIYELPFKYNLVYIIPITAANLAVLYMAARYLSDDKRGFFDLSRNVSLVAMTIALLTYLLSSIFYVAL